MDPKPITPGIHRLTLAISLLAVGVGPALFLIPDRTETLFAWTILPPLTAMFLGGLYTMALVTELTAARAQLWANARVFYPGMVVFTTLTLIATLLHLDRFHFSSTAPIAQLTAYAWLVIYLLAPGVMIALVAFQVRQPGGEPLRVAPLPSWYRAALLIEAAPLILFGAWLFLVPGAAGPLWPWPLTPLTARAASAWLVGLGIAAAHASVENDWRRIQPASAGNAVAGGLQLLAVLRFATTIDWEKPSALVYVLFLTGMLFLGMYGWYAATKARS